MSEEAEKIEAIKHAVVVAQKTVDKLELVQSCSKLCKEQIYELDMARECVRRGNQILSQIESVLLGGE